MMNQTTALITGAAHGIGAACIQDLAAQGIRHFILLDKDQAALEVLAERYPDLECHLLCTDLSQPETFQTELPLLLSQLPPLQVVVNNAGTAQENEPDDWHNWRKILALNLDAPFLIGAICIPYLQEGASIINIASILGRAGKVRNSGYCASKHGLLGYTKALALDLAPRRIRVNAILPGWVDTPMLQRELQQQAQLLGMPDQKILRNARKQIPLRRFVLAEEVASMVAYLASSAASAVTAQSFTIDGGFTCGM